MAVLTDLLVQAAAGALGGGAVGKLVKSDKPGVLGNLISGALGGGLGGTLLSSVIPSLAGAASGGGALDIGVLLGQAAGGGVTGAAVTLLYNVLKKRFFG